MRLIRISAPAGKGDDIAKVAFGCGVQEVSIHHAEQHKANASPKPKDIVDIQIATPDSKSIIEALVRAPFFDRDEFSLDVREPRAILKSSLVREVTRPVAAPMIDIDQELWQFTHVTPSFVARVFIVALLLAYGMIHDNPLFMIGGLVFLPFMPLLLASFGALTGQWSLVAQSLIAFVTATILIVVGAAAVASAADPPLMFDMFAPVVAGAFFSVIIAIAAALATADDAGHRQLIGLAAASQVALIPAWFGISFVFGFSESPAEKLSSFGLNVAALLVGAALVYGVLMPRKRARSIANS